ncbi:hypothetical protein D3C85_1514130 [compost metagenome]
MQGFPFIVGRLIAAEGRVFTVRGGLSEHQGQDRHTLTMPAGIRALGINRTGQQLDERVQQLFLPGLQPLAFDTHRGGTGHGL